MEVVNDLGVPCEVEYAEGCPGQDPPWFLGFNSTSTLSYICPYECAGSLLLPPVENVKAVFDASFQAFSSRRSYDGLSVSWDEPQDDSTITSFEVCVTLSGPCGCEELDRTFCDHASGDFGGSCVSCDGILTPEDCRLAMAPTAFPTAASGVKKND